MKNYFKIGVLVGTFLALVVLFTGFVLVQSIVQKAENISELDLTTLNYQTLNGESVEIKDYAGKQILINFWATWCAPCIAEFPLLNKVYKLLENDYVFIMVSFESNKKIKAFVEKNNYGFVFLKSNNFMEEGITTIPQSFILNSETELVYHHPTVFDDNALSVRDSLQVWVGLK